MCAVVGAAATKLKKKKRRKLWYKKLLSMPNERESFAQICSELEREWPRDFENYTRMSVNSFYNLLTKIEPYIRKEDTHLRESISPGACLEAILRFLAAGGSYASVSMSFKNI